MSKSLQTRFGDWLYAHLCKVFGEPELDAIQTAEEFEELDIEL